MRTLVLTGWEGFWPESKENVLYLGNWCFSNNPRCPFTEIEGKDIVPSPWENPEDVVLASAYIDKIFDIIIPQIAEFLNNWYGTKFSIRFWEIIIGPWLLHWLHWIYDRYKSILYVKYSLADNEIIKVNILDGPYIFNQFDYFPLVYYLRSHQANLSLYSQIIRYCQFEYIMPEYSSLKIEASLLPEYNSSTSSLQYGDKQIFEKGRKIFQSDICFGTVYGLNRYDRYHLHMYRIGRRITHIKKKMHYSKYIRPRYELKDKPIICLSLLNDPFCKLITKMFPSSIPNNYLVGIPDGNELSGVKYFIGSGPDLTDYYKRVKIAKMIEDGGNMISVQHGAGYGQFQNFPLGRIEYCMTSNFISWGWTHRHCYDGKIVSLPNPHFIHRRRKLKKCLLYISTAQTSYVIRISPPLLPHCLKRFITDTGEFVNSLPEPIQKDTWFRPYIYNNFGIDFTSEVIKVIPKERMLLKQNNIFKDNDWEPALTVIDHPGTAWLESLAAGWPTIAFWRPENFMMDDEAAADLEHIQKASLYFTSPKMASEHISNIWNNVENWWNLKDVQEMKNNFVRKYAWSENDYIKYWKKFIKELP